MVFRAASIGVGGVVASSAHAAVPSTLYSQAPETFTTSTRYVTADLFTWFTAFGGQQTSNWTPLEGRPAWDGGVNFWTDQVKQIMSANIDTLYVHMYGTQDRAQRQNLFNALSQLRAKGYDVPKVAPWLDDGGFSGVADLSTSTGKSTFVTPYTQFFTDYYTYNTDAAADSYLHQVGGHLVLNTWQTRDKCTNQGSLSRSDLETPLKTAFAAAHPVFNNSVRMTSLVYIDPNINFIDEMIPEYQDTAQQVYYYPGNTNQYDGGNQPYLNGYKTASIKPGFWNQNDVAPSAGGKFLARNGGANYKAAWDTAIADRGTLKHIKLESWNEYTEGSGLFRANTTPVRNAGVTANDTWSSTNDPLEYVKTTADKARQFNDTADRNASFLYSSEVPKTMTPGQVLTVPIVMRNTGDLAWKNSGDYKFGEFDTDPVKFLSRVLINDSSSDVTTYGGVFRGAPYTFNVTFTAPTQPGVYNINLSMLQENVTWFGQTLNTSITVLPEPGMFAFASVLILSTLPRRRHRNRQTP